MRELLATHNNRVAVKSPAARTSRYLTARGMPEKPKRKPRHPGLDGEYLLPYRFSHVGGQDRLRDRGDIKYVVLPVVVTEGKFHNEVVDVILVDKLPDPAIGGRHKRGQQRDEAVHKTTLEVAL